MFEPDTFRNKPGTSMLIMNDALLRHYPYHQLLIFFLYRNSMQKTKVDTKESAGCFEK